MMLGINSAHMNMNSPYLKRIKRFVDVKEVRDGNNGDNVQNHNRSRLSKSKLWRVGELSWRGVLTRYIFQRKARRTRNRQSSYFSFKIYPYITIVENQTSPKCNLSL
jgi:hypothetical protein